MNRIKRWATLAFQITLISQPAAVLAESISKSETNLEEIVVQASLLHQNADSNATPLHVVDQGTLAQLPVLSLGDALDALLGVTTADYGSGVGQPVIRGLSGSRVRVLQNGLVARDVSNLGGDHLNEVDTRHAQQIEVIRGPASLLFSNGSIGGIVNIVDKSIAREDFEELELQISGETQSVNSGDAGSLAFSNHFAGLNLSYAGSYSNLNDYKVPRGAVTHEEDHEGDEHEEDDHGDDDHEAENLRRLMNSDTLRETHILGASKTGDWGYVGASYAHQESLYGIPVHADAHGGEHGDEHDEEHGDDHDEEHGDDHDEDHDDDHNDHAMHGEGERIFSTTQSKVWTVEGQYNLTDRLLNRLGYHFRDSDYTLTEQHAEAEAGDDAHDGEEHHEEGPTVFSNQSKEFGVKLNFDTQRASHRVVLNAAEEKISIIGEEAFINPNKSKEITAGYYFSREWPGLFHFDFGARFDNISRSGSVAHHDEAHHDDDEHHEDDHDEDHDDDHGDDHDGDGDHDEDEKMLEQFDLDFETTSFAGTVSKSFGENLEVSMGLAKVERSPSTIELFINGPHLAAQRFEVGSTALKPEDSRNAELSFAYESGAFFWDFTAFNNQIADYIYLRDETDTEHEAGDEHDHGSLTLGNYVQADATFTGYEAQIGTVIPLDAGQIRLKLGRDQTRATLDRGGYVPRIPATRDLFEVYGDFARFNAVLSYQKVHAQNRASESEEPTRGYDMVNLSISAPLTLGPMTLDATFFARNVLDEKARRHTSFVKEDAPLPGRNLGIRLSLGL